MVGSNPVFIYNFHFYWMSQITMKLSLRMRSYVYGFTLSDILYVYTELPYIFLKLLVE